MPSNALRDAVTENDQATIVFDGEFLPASFRTQSYEIARDVVRYVCRGDDYQVPPSKVLQHADIIICAQYYLPSCIIQIFLRTGMCVIQNNNNIFGLNTSI